MVEAFAGFVILECVYRLSTTTGHSVPPLNPHLGPSLFFPHLPNEGLIRRLKNIKVQRHVGLFELWHVTSSSTLLNSWIFCSTVLKNLSTFPLVCDDMPCG